MPTCPAAGAHFPRLVRVRVALLLEVGHRLGELLHRLGQLGFFGRLHPLVLGFHVLLEVRLVHFGHVGGLASRELHEKLKLISVESLEERLSFFMPSLAV